MNLEYLRTFVSIVEHGSLSAAARAKRISQPAVTKQIPRLESETSLPLLVRSSRRPLEFTPAWERFLVFVQETLARLEVLERELATLKAIGPGTLGSTQAILQAAAQELGLGFADASSCPG